MNDKKLNIAVEPAFKPKEKIKSWYSDREIELFKKKFGKDCAVCKNEVPVDDRPFFLLAEIKMPDVLRRACIPCGDAILATQPQVGKNHWIYGGEYTCPQRFGFTRNFYEAYIEPPAPSPVPSTPAEKFKALCDGDVDIATDLDLPTLLDFKRRIELADNHVRNGSKLANKAYARAYAAVCRRLDEIVIAQLVLPPQSKRGRLL